MSAWYDRSYAVSSGVKKRFCLWSKNFRNDSLTPSKLKDNISWSERITPGGHFLFISEDFSEDEVWKCKTVSSFFQKILTEYSFYEKVSNG